MEANQYTIEQYHLCYLTCLKDDPYLRIMTSLNKFFFPLKDFEHNFFLCHLTHFVLLFCAFMKVGHHITTLFTNMTLPLLLLRVKYHPQSKNSNTFVFMHCF